MSLVRCDVKLNGTPSGPGIGRRPGHHHGTHQHRQRQHRVRTTDGGVCANTRGIDAGSTILPTNPRSTDGLRAPTTDHQPTTAGYRPASKAVLAPTMRPYSTRAINADSEERTGRSLEVTSGPRNQRRDATRVGRDDPRCTTIWRGSPRFQDAVSQRPDSGGQSGSGCSLGSGRQRPEISRLPGLFRVGSNSVERLDCSTPNGHTTQTRQLSRRAVEDAVCIQSLEGNSLRLDSATRPGGRNDRGGRPNSFYTTPGSSFWGPRPSSHRPTENAGD